MVVVAQHALEELFAGASADTVAELVRKALAAGPLPPDCVDQLAAVLALRGDRPGAVIVRGRAARLAERCDATALAQRLRALTAPEPAPAAPAQFAGVDAFTPAERQVTALVIKA